MIFDRLRCMANRHRPLRRGVEWDGFTYMGTCSVCGVPIRRKSGGGWRKLEQPHQAADIKQD